jgi:hypothetical protein
VVRTRQFIGTQLRTPRAAGIAGVLFSVLLGTALVLIGVSAPSEPSEAGTWLTDSSRRGAVALALNLVPFAGIAFLWFIGVIRDRIGQHEDRLFATAFLGSGLLFVGMLFAAAAVAAGLLADPAIESGGIPSPEIWGLGRRITFTVLNVYAIRMGAVFILSTTTIGRRTRIIPGWLVIAGTLAALVLLVGTGLSTWVNLVLPIWVLVLSVYILLNNAEVERRGKVRRGKQRAARQGHEAETPTV